MISWTSKKLKLGHSGGIRSSIKNNLIADVEFNLKDGQEDEMTPDMELHNLYDMTEDVAESDIGILKKPKRSRSEIESDLDKINKKILKNGPKKGNTSRTKEENKRDLKIVTLLKERYKKICKIPHFETENNATYSEAHHLIPWAKSHDDTRENLVVLCPTCHKKFDHATKPTKISMYDQLVKNFPDETFQKPPDIT